VPAGRRDGDDLVIELRVQPRASRNGLDGLHGGRLKVRLQAPPVDGRANDSLVALMAEVFGVPRARIVIEQGLAGRDKRLRIRGAGGLPPGIADLLGCD
jgi:uncharacterized protein (TIGR00251 family)